MIVWLFVYLLGSNTSAFNDFDSHGSWDDISRSEILSSGSVSFHESFTVSIDKFTTFSSATFSHEATRAVNTSRMELHEFRIFNGETSSSDNTETITSASMCGSAWKISSSVSTSCENSVVSSNSVNGTISNGHADNTSASTFLVHNQIKDIIFNEEIAVVSKRSSE